MQYIFLIYGAGLLSCCILFAYALRRFGRGWSLQRLYYEFNRKIWMTLFLGMTFFGLYLGIVLLSAKFAQPFAAKILVLARQHPKEFVYGGLCVFALLSLSIYFTRMIIKYFYLTRGKDS